MLRQPQQERFLVLRNDVFYYWRRVPKALKVRSTFALRLCATGRPKR
jgi:hypothetical protein